MKKWWVWGGLLLLVIAGMAVYSLSQFSVMNAWEGKQVFMPNKVLGIKFSQKVDAKSLEFIYVTNDKGEKVETTLSLGDDQKIIYISPPENGYDADAEKYTVHIDKGIESSVGRRLSNSRTYDFVVKETLPTIGSQEKLAGYFKNILKEQKNSRGWFSMEEATKDAANEKSSESADSNNVSETNVQVQGVDEADIVKTDGKYIFQADQMKVQIIKAQPAGQMKLISTISFGQNFNPHQLYLEADQLVVIGYQYHNFSKPADKIAKDSLIAPMIESTKAIVYNVKNPENPVQIREVELEGHYVSSRKVDGVVYLISGHYPNIWLLEENSKIDLRPKIKDTASDMKETTISYDEIRYFPDSREPNYTLIAAFDLAKPSEKASITTYLGSGDQIYMSKENLYLAVQNRGEQPMDERGIIAPDTDIHKFAVKGMNVNFHSSTTVPGMVLNQFSMDEHEGYFRLVTTKGYAWDESKPSSNHLYILDENLKQAGKLEDLARGERIYSARFMGNRIYMVTFKETDPLFVIEASDPANPKVLGELKIPGFSNYLHPYDENHIIGFGHDTKIVAEKGNTQPRILTNGVKISMFDVSDMSNPKEKFTEIIGGRGTYSQLNYDHKALLFNKNKNIFAFPISVYQNSDKNEYEQIFEFQGAYVYNIDPVNGFKLKSKITHIKGQQPYYEEYDTGIQRLLYIGDTLYALSPAKITSHDLKTSNQIGELSLR